MESTNMCIVQCALSSACPHVLVRKNGRKCENRGWQQYFFKETEKSWISAWVGFFSLLYLGLHPKYILELCVPLMYRFSQSNHCFLNIWKVKKKVKFLLWVGFFSLLYWGEHPKYWKFKLFLRLNCMSASMYQFSTSSHCFLYISKVGEKVEFLLG